MHKKMTENTGAEGDGVGARQRAFGELHGRRRPHGNDVTLRTGRVKRRTKLANDVDTAVTDLIEMIDRRDDTAGAGLGSEDRLRRVENEQAGHARAVVGEATYGTDGVFDERNQNDDLIRETRELLTVAIDIVAVDGANGDVHGHVDETTDLRELLALVTLLLAQKRRRRHHAVEKPTGCGPGDVVEIGAREKNLHASSRYSSRGYATWSRNSAFAGAGAETPLLSVAPRSASMSSNGRWPVATSIIVPMRNRTI